MTDRSSVRWWTCFLGHSWSQWEQVNVVVTLDRDPSLFLSASSPEAWAAMTTVKGTRQRRSCVLCGRVQTEHV